MPPDKKKSPVKIHFAVPPGGPRASGVAAPGLATPGKIEFKGQPDGRPGQFGGYYDDPQDLPADYYHGMWREHDHGRVADARQRKQLRDMAQGWVRTAAQLPQNFAREAKHRYKQPGDFCFATTSAFFYMRRIGFSPALAIAVLRMPWLQEKIPAWQNDFEATKFVPAFGVSNYWSDEFTKIMKKLYAGQKAGKFASTVMTHPIAADDIWFLQEIGTYPDGMLSNINRLVDLRVGKNMALAMPRVNPTFKAVTMQQALFQSYQAPRESKIPLARGRFRGEDFGRRKTCPFVYIHCEGVFKGLPSAHAILADFSDPLHPGIFDPNFGWMEPEQGHCYLLFEIALNCLWEHYTSHNLGNPAMGVRHHEGIDLNHYFKAMQIYEQQRLG